MCGKDPENNAKWPAECVECGVSEGPLYGINDECPGWMCPKCYAKALKESEKLMDDTMGIQEPTDPDDEADTEVDE